MIGVTPLPDENTGEDSAGAGSRAAVTPFLEALRYDAAFHYNRGKPLPPPIVPKSTFWKALWRRTTANVWGTALLLLALAFFSRAAIHAYTDIGVYNAAQPQIIEVTETHVGDITQSPPQIHTVTVLREVPSTMPLPKDWEETTLKAYLRFLLIIGVCSYLGAAGLRRAGTIETGVPVTSANTGHLPAVESLVRASSRPVEADPRMLLRAAVGRPEAQAEQLVRPVGGG